jgi:hypothetical protein
MGTHKTGGDVAFENKVGINESLEVLELVFEATMLLSVAHPLLLHLQNNPLSTDWVVMIPPLETY